MRTLQIIALILTIIGALNWGLVGLFDFDLVANIFGGSDEIIPRVIYSLIGICGLINLRLLFEMFDEK